MTEVDTPEPLDYVELLGTRMADPRLLVTREVSSV
jgi:hypothetical protein